MKKPRVKHNYVDNKRLYAEMTTFIHGVREVEEQGLGRESWPEIPRYVGKAILDIATNLASRGNFYGYSYKDEMISDAIENCIKYINKFNPDKFNNPFAYFTKIIYFAFLRRISSEKTQQYIKYKAFLDVSVAESLAGPPKGGRRTASEESFNAEKYEEFVEKFETNKKLNKSTKKKGVEKFIDE